MHSSGGWGSDHRRQNIKMPSAVERGGGGKKKKPLPEREPRGRQANPGSLCQRKTPRAKEEPGPREVIQSQKEKITRCSPARSHDSQGNQKKQDVVEAHTVGVVERPQKSGEAKMGTRVCGPRNRESKF